MLTTLPYSNFKCHRANTKLYLILIYTHADCLKSIYQKEVYNKYAFKQYTSTIWQLYMLLTSDVLLLNVVLSLDNGPPKYPWGEFCTLHYSRAKKYKSQIIMYVNSIAVTALLPYPEIIGIPINLFLIPTWQYKLRLLIVFKWLAI